MSAYKIGTSHMCRKCGGPVIAHEADIEVARLRAWIKDAPHRHDCPLRSLADRHQGQQHPCTCGRNHLLGEDP